MMKPNIHNVTRNPQQQQDEKQGIIDVEGVVVCRNQVTQQDAHQSSSIADSTTHCVSTDERTKKKQMQHSQGSGDHADHARSKSGGKINDDDTIPEPVGPFSVTGVGELDRASSSVAATSTSGNAEPRRDSTQETTSFQVLIARVVHEHSPVGPIVVEATPVEFETVPESQHRDGSLFKSRKCRIMSTLTFAFIIGAIAAVVLFTQKGLNAGPDSKTEAPNSGNETASDLFLQELKPLLSNESLSALEDPGSPQSLSLRWLVNSSNFRTLPFHRKVQRYAMVTIYYATGGQSWSNSGGNWLTDETECRWFQGSEGDFCDDNGTALQTLNQSSNALNGKIPDEIRLLSSLTVIDLSMNQISGTLSSKIGLLTALTHMTFGNNALTGTVPSELGFLTALTYMTLDKNGFKGTVPSELSSMTVLTHLSIGSNFLMGTLPSELGSMTALTLLSLNGNRLIWVLPSELGSLTGLRHLNLERNSFSGAVPSELGSLTALEEFVLGTNGFISTVPSELGSLTALNVLVLDWTSLTGTVPSELGFLTALTYMALGNNALMGIVPSELGFLTALTNMQLDNNDFTGTVPSELGALTALTSLSLWGNSLTGTVPSEFGFLTALTFMTLDHNDFTGTIPSELGFLTVLGHMTLDNNDFTGTIPSELGFLTALTHMTLDNNDFTGTVPSEFGFLTALTALTLDHNDFNGTVPARGLQSGELLIV